MAFILLIFFMKTGGAVPVLEYYVTDEAGVLFIDEIYDIEDICLEVDINTGAQIAVVIVETTQPDGIDLFAFETFDQNGIGQEGKDNGLLILISVDEKMWRIEVGYGLEGILPDVLVADIARNSLEPYLNASDYYSGIYLTTYEIGEIILENYDGEPPEDDGPWYPIPFIPLNWWQLTLAIIVLIGVFILTNGGIYFWVGGAFGKSGGGFGGGRSGGGGAKGRF